MTDTSVDLKELPQKALRKIRALCKGNGAPADAVQIKSAKGEIIQCEAITHIELHPDIVDEKKKGRHQVGQVFEKPEQMKKTIDDYVAQAIKNDDTRKYLANILLERPDKGFSLHAEYFDVEPLNQSYSLQVPCSTCQGHGNAACNRCGGQRRETCPQCHGRTMVPCNYCNSSGFMQGPSGEQKQCNRCFGQRQMACTLCQKAGAVACRQCKGSGTSQCNSCKGAAFFTHITHLVMKMKTLFEIDRAALPHPAVKIIEDAGWKMAEKGHIKLHAEQVKREDGGLAIQYDTEFPYGDLELTINGKPLKTHLFGYKGKMLKLPNFLDNLLELNIQLLDKAAHNQGNVSAHIRKVSKTRFIGDALLLAVTAPPKKAMMGLKKKYPMGASNDLIKNIIVMSNKALANATRKTRYGGLGLGMLLAGLLDAAYLFGPIRGMAAGSLGENITMAIDLGLVLLGGLISGKAAVFMAKRPLKSALGSLMPDNKRGRFKAKSPNNIWIGYALSALVMLIMIYVAKVSGAAVPGWFPL